MGFRVKASSFGRDEVYGFRKQKLSMGARLAALSAPLELIRLRGFFPSRFRRVRF